MKNKYKKPQKNNAPRGDRPIKKGAPKRDKPQKSAPLAPQKPKINAPLYGMHAVQEAWRNPERKISALYLTDKAAEGFDLRAPDGVKRPAPTIVDKRDLDHSLPQGAVHQGIALQCSDLPEVGVEDLIIATREKTDSLIIILDQVTDPHNVGAIIRSCAAFGADGLIMQRKHAPELTGVLAKTACGGAEHVPVAYETNLSRTIETLKEGGYFAYGLDERGEQHIGDLKKGGKSVLVLGAEGSGLRRLVAEHCDALVKLPTQPPIASLNVSNAAAVALYALIG